MNMLVSIQTSIQPVIQIIKIIFTTLHNWNWILIKVLFLIAIIQAIWEIYGEIKSGNFFKKQIEQITTTDPFIYDYVYYGRKYTLISVIFDLWFLLEHFSYDPNFRYKALCVFIFLTLFYVLQLLPILWLIGSFISWIVIFLLLLASRLFNISFTFRFGDTYPHRNESIFGLLKKTFVMCFYHNLRIIFLFKASERPENNPIVTREDAKAFLLRQITFFPFFLIKICFLSASCMTKVLIIFVFNRGTRPASKARKFLYFLISLYTSWQINVLKSSEAITELGMRRNCLIKFENGIISTTVSTTIRK